MKSLVPTPGRVLGAESKLEHAFFLPPSSPDVIITQLAKIKLFLRNRVKFRIPTFQSWTQKKGVKIYVLNRQQQTHNYLLNFSPDLGQIPRSGFCKILEDLSIKQLAPHWKIAWIFLQPRRTGPPSSRPDTMASSFVLLLVLLALCGAEVREFIETEKSGDGDAPDTENTREEEYPFKETIYGPIRGHLVEEKGIVAEVYTRVPYAKAPVGMLRFKVNSFLLS